MTKVAFLGLGRMGAPMAQRLVDAGHDVVVWNRTPQRTDGFTDVGADPVQAVAGAEMVVTMLADAEAVREVVFESGMAKALRPDAVFVDMGTIGVRAARRLHESVDRATLDAPVGGGVAQAASGELVVLVGGDEGALDRVRSVLEVFGDVIRCGGPGAGQAMKLVFNAVLAVTMAGIGEAVAFGEKLGLATDRMVEVLGRGGAGPMVKRKGEFLAERSYPASFALSLMRKDVGLVGEAGRDAQAWQPLATLVLDLYRRAEREGLEEDDYSAITELFRRS
jgi:3-hydroxyisobutyrate dehydrogenase-like beta-hydroxyacid dehydrogenase